VRPDELNNNEEVRFAITHAFIVELSVVGRQRCQDWARFEQAEERDLAEYERLKKKFEGLVS
jgi:hypothetical protein